MSKKGKVRSIRGEVVDFDLLKVKQNMEDRNKPDSVEMREKYIDIRRRRNPRRNVADLVNEQRQNEQDARDKIAKSKEARELAAATKAEEEVSEVGSEETSVEPTPAATSATPRKTSKRKVVKRTPPTE